MDDVRLLTGPGRPNALIVGPRAATDPILEAVMPQLTEPVCAWECSQPLTVPSAAPCMPVRSSDQRPAFATLYAAACDRRRRVVVAESQRTATALSLFGYAVPGFWLGQLVLLFFAVKLGWFPVGGYVDIRTEYTGLAHVRDVLYHLILPAAVLAVSEIALLARVTRANLMDQSGKGYIRTARAKGLPLFNR